MQQLQTAALRRPQEEEETDKSKQAYIPSPMAIGRSVPEMKYFKYFYHIKAWRPSWLCDIPRTIFRYPDPLRLYMQIVYNRYSGFKEPFENIDNDNNDDASLPIL